MPSGNFDDAPLPETAPVPAPKRFRMPADYYSSPTSEIKRIFPTWVPMGCGAGAIVFLIALFAGGAFLASGGMAGFLDFVLGMSVSDMRGQFAKDITPAQKDAFEKQLEALRENVRNEKLPVDRLQPVLREMQTVLGDSKVSADELERLTTVIRNSNKPR